MRDTLRVTWTLLLFALLWPVVMLFGTLSAIAEDTQGMK